MIRNLQLVELSWQYERNVSVRSADLLGNLRLALEYLPISSTSITTASGLHWGSVQWCYLVDILLTCG
jgi:hypothetical protein